MALLKEDGSLDIEWINKLPLEEYHRELIKLTNKQYHEYTSKLPLNESNGGVQPIVVDSVEDYLKEGHWVNAFDVVNNM